MLYNTTPDPINKLRIKNNLTFFLLQIIQDGEFSKNSKTNPAFKTLISYIIKNINNKFEIKDLANKMNLSESHFKHRFRKEVGIPPKEFVLRQKLEKAKDLLKDPSISISDIAYDLDFSSPSYFATVFKRFNRVSPYKYRITLMSEENTVP